MREQLTADVNLAAAARSNVIPGRVGQVVRIRGTWLQSAGAQTITLWGGREMLGGPLLCAAGSQISLPMTIGDAAWFELPIGEGLDIEQSAAVQLSGWVPYAYR